MSKIMTKTKAIVFTVIIAVLVLTLALFIFPLNGEDSFKIGNSNYDFVWVSKAIDLGLDVQGGMYVIYEAQTDGLSNEEAQNAIDGTMSNLRTLLASKGYTEAVVSQQGGNNIRVEIPAVQDSEELISLLSEPAKLEFKDADGNVVIRGNDHLEDAQATYYEGYYAISLTFNDEGTKAFAEATSNNIGKEISIYVNGKELISPTVNTAITDGKAIITGNYTYDSANQLAIQLKAGTFDVELKTKQTSTISASLGEKALQMGLIAGVIGLAVVLIFMLVIYKGLGILADFAMIIYTVLLMYALAIVPWVQLTLPGIAGVILSIGMAVDANVIIFERIKDERLISNRSIASSTKAGIKKATPAILDGNITTIIGAIVMIALGSTAIKSFAITLLIGIILSLVSSLLITRLLLNISLAFNDTNYKYYGLPMIAEEVVDDVEA